MQLPRLLAVCSVLLNFDLSFSQGVWTQKANFPAGGREEAIGFNVGMKGYFGMGTEILGPRHNDMWEYDPVLNTWTPKDSMPGQRRWGAFSFAIGNMGYVGTGFGSSPYLQDFWEYNTQNNTWMQKANFGGPGRYSAFGISIGNKGYAGTGYTSSGYAQDFYEYDPLPGTWSPIANFPTVREGANFVSIGQKGYVGNGNTSLGPNYQVDWWEYSPDSILAGTSDLVQNVVSCTIYPNPVVDHLCFTINPGSYALSGISDLKIYNLPGNLVRHEKIYLNSTRLDIREMVSGVYFYSVSYGGSGVFSGNFVVVRK